MNLQQLQQKHVQSLEKLDGKTPISPLKTKIQKQLVIQKRLLKKVSTELPKKNNIPPKGNPFKSKVVAPGQINREIKNVEIPKDAFKKKELKDSKAAPKIENQKVPKNAFKNKPKEVEPKKKKAKKPRNTKNIIADNINIDPKEEFKKY